MQFFIVSLNVHAILKLMRCASEIIICLGAYSYLTFYTISINLKVDKNIQNFITIFNAKVFLIFKKHLSILIAQFRFHELVHTEFCIFSSTMHGAINIKISSWNLDLYNLEPKSTCKW
jgi:hypothetical protein